MNVAVSELAEVDIVAAIERQFEVLDGVTEARDTVEALALYGALPLLDLVYALLDHNGPDRVGRLDKRGQVNAEYALDVAHLGLAVRRRSLRALLVRLEATVLAFHALGDQAPHEIQAEIAPVGSFESN